MSAYVILDIDVRDQQLYEEYKKKGAATLAAYGGKPLARGGRSEVLEGSWQPKRLVIIEFPSMDHLKKWWNSQEYSLAKEIRHKAADTNVVFIEGF